MFLLSCHGLEKWKNDIRSTKKKKESTFISQSSYVLHQYPVLINVAVWLLRFPDALLCFFFFSQATRHLARKKAATSSSRRGSASPRRWPPGGRGCRARGSTACAKLATTRAAAARGSSRDGRSSKVTGSRAMSTTGTEPELEERTSTRRTSRGIWNWGRSLRSGSPSCKPSGCRPSTLTYFVSSSKTRHAFYLSPWRSCWVWLHNSHE